MLGRAASRRKVRQCDEVGRCDFGLEVGGIDYLDVKVGAEPNASRDVGSGSC